jgi:ubiquinone/menaquinone biosynthesis C-methylase UbiE
MKQDPLTKRSFWEVYTVNNIMAELAYRFHKLVQKLDAPKIESSRSGLTNPEFYNATHANRVGQFYDDYHDKFRSVYGTVIQAFRTRDITKLLDYQINRIGLQAGQKVLDAGCGFGTPAIYFAQHADVQIDAITISEKQYQLARQNCIEKKVDDRVRVIKGDYHKLTDYFDKESFDVIYFLESFGHSTAKKQLLAECWKLLKPGGTLYIKDLFQRLPLLPDHQPLIEHEIQKINTAYCYEVADINNILDAVRGMGFILLSLSTIDLPLNDFENLAISNEFQELTGIALIENWNEYIFPVDFFELKCMKPEFDIEKRLDRYFLQNLYYNQFKDEITI